jgi:hypothetical protein
MDARGAPFFMRAPVTKKKNRRGAANMKTMLFEVVTDHRGGHYLRPSGVNDRLGGKNLIYREWLRRGCPVNQMWHASAGDMIRTLTNGALSPRSVCLLADMHPRSGSRIELVEILDVYGWFITAEAGRPPLSRAVLTLREVFRRSFGKNSVTGRVRAQILEWIPAPDFRARVFTAETRYALPGAAGVTLRLKSAASRPVPV